MESAGTPTNGSESINADPFKIANSFIAAAEELQMHMTLARLPSISGASSKDEDLDDGGNVFRRSSSARRENQNLFFGSSRAEFDRTRELPDQPEPETLVKALLGRYFEGSLGTAAADEESPVCGSGQATAADDPSQDTKPQDIKPDLLQNPRADAILHVQFRLEHIHTWLVRTKGMLPSIAVALQNPLGGSSEILVMDMANRSNISFFEATMGSSRLTPKSCIGPFEMTSSAVRCDRQGFLCVTDRSGAYFMNPTTKQMLSFVSILNLWGAQLLVDKVVCVREGPTPSIVTLEPSSMVPTGELVLESKIPAMRKTMASTIQRDRPCGQKKGFLKHPAFRFMAVDAESSEDLRFALVDWGLDSIFIVNTEGKLVKLIGGRGIQPGQFQDPGGAVFLPDGRLLVVDSRNHRLQLFSGQDFSVLWSGPLPGDIKRPTGMTLEKTSDGVLHLFVCHLGQPGVSMYRVFG